MLLRGEHGRLDGVGLTLALEVLNEIDRRPARLGSDVIDDLSMALSADRVTFIGAAMMGVNSCESWQADLLQSKSPKPRSTSSVIGWGNCGLGPSALSFFTPDALDLPFSEPMDLRVLSFLPTPVCVSVAGDGGWEIVLEGLSLPSIPLEGFRLPCWFMERASSVL